MSDSASVAPEKLLEYYSKVTKEHVEVWKRQQEEEGKSAKSIQRGPGWSLTWAIEELRKQEKADELNELTKAFLGKGKVEFPPLDETESAIDKFLEGKLIDDGAKTPNSSQKQAIYKALNSVISFVQGPPGTGKTDTILNMVSCILKQNGTVAVVARNRAALTSIEEKVKALGEGADKNGQDLKDKFARLGSVGERRKWSDGEFEFHDGTGGIEKEIKAKEFLGKYPFLLCTIHSLKKCFRDGRSHQYDYVIMDEASQCDIIAGIVAMSSAKHLVLVGDKEQLPPVFTRNEKIKRLTEKIPESYKIKEGASFLTSCLAVFEGAPSTLLNRHYRCHPGIIGFCNEEIYDEELEIETKGYDTDIKTPIKVLWFEGNYCERCKREGSGERPGFTRRNMRQIEIFMQEEWPYLQKNEDLSVCILSPFKGQLTELEKRIKEKEGDVIECDFDGEAVRESKDEEDSPSVPTMLTIHKSQGQEFDLVYLLPVEDGDWEWPWSQGKSIVNVAVSRAKKELRLIVSSSLMEEDMQRELTGVYIKPRENSAKNEDEKEGIEESQHYIKKLVKYVRKRMDPKEGGYMGERGYPESDGKFGFHRAESSSIFDAIPWWRQEFPEGRPSAPERCLKELLAALCCQDDNLNYAREVPLKECFPKKTRGRLRGQKEDKERFIEDGSRFDFILFDHDRRLLLAIEVDGEPHRVRMEGEKDDTKLKEREKNDRLKEEIARDYDAVVVGGNELKRSSLEEASFILLRLPTDGSMSNEREIIERLVKSQRERRKGEKDHNTPRWCGEHSQEKLDGYRPIDEVLESWRSCNRLSGHLSSVEINKLLEEGRFITPDENKATEKGRAVGIIQAVRPEKGESDCCCGFRAEKTIFDYLERTSAASTD